MTATSGFLEIIFGLAPMKRHNSTHVWNSNMKSIPKHSKVLKSFFLLSMQFGMHLCFMFCNTSPKRRKKNILMSWYHVIYCLMTGTSTFEETQ